MLSDYVHADAAFERIVVGHGGPVLISYENRKTAEYGEIRLDCVESVHFDDVGAVVVMRSGVSHHFPAPPDDSNWWVNAQDVLAFWRTSTRDVVV